MKFFNKGNKLLIALLLIIGVIMDLIVKALHLSETISSAVVMLPISIVIEVILSNLYVYARKNYKKWAFIPAFLLLGVAYTLCNSIIILSKEILI